MRLKAFIFPPRVGLHFYRHAQVLWLQSQGLKAIKPDISQTGRQTPSAPGAIIDCLYRRPTVHHLYTVFPELAGIDERTFTVLKKTFHAPATVHVSGGHISIIRPRTAGLVIWPLTGSIDPR